MTATGPEPVRFRAVVLSRRLANATARCTGCLWVRYEYGTGRHARLRAASLRHVRTTGHVVQAVYETASEYGPELGPGR